MNVDLSSATIVAGLVIAAVPAVFGWLIVRAVRGVDRAIESLNEKIEQLVQQDTRTQVEVADLRARVVHLEYIVLGKSAPLARGVTRQ